MNAPRAKLTGLQALRAVAAVLVVLFHVDGLCAKYELPGRFLGGFFWFGHAGVDMFFVLSGFIIFFIHARDVGEPGRFRPFAVKRLIRIYPIFWIIMLVVVPVYFLQPSFGVGYEREPAVIVKSFLLLPMDQFPIIPQAWSLSHEMLFYLLFGVAILAGRRPAIGLLALMGLASAAMWAHLMLNGGKSGLPFALQFIFSFYNLEFLLGCLCAVLATRAAPPAVPVACGLLVAGAAWFTICGQFNAMLHGVLGEAHGVLSYGVPAAVVIHALVTLERHDALRVPRWLRYVGDASYSLYLSHTMVISLAIKVLIGSGGAKAIGTQATGLVLLAAAVLGGCACYALIEAPVLRLLRQRLLPRRTPRPAPQPYHAP